MMNLKYKIIFISKAFTYKLNLHFQPVLSSAGAHLILNQKPRCTNSRGLIVTIMPGLPKHPSGIDMDVTEEGKEADVFS